MKILILSLLLPIQAMASQTIDYLTLEDVANSILCESESRCESTKINPEKEQSGDYYVGDILLPGDALRDDEQQKAMIPASLYVKKDGSVASIPSEEDINKKQIKNMAKAAKRSKSLPVQLFEPVKITPRVNQVVISVK